MTSVDRNTEEAVRRFVGLIPSGWDVASTILFGSRARGTYDQDSDADLAIILNGKAQPVLKTSLDLADLAFDVLLETGINITPLPIWVNEWEHPQTHSNPMLLANIAREGVRFS